MVAGAFARAGVAASGFDNQGFPVKGFACAAGVSASGFAYAGEDTGCFAYACVTSAAGFASSFACAGVATSGTPTRCCDACVAPRGCEAEMGRGWTNMVVGVGLTSNVGPVLGSGAVFISRFAGTAGDDDVAKVLLPDVGVAKFLLPDEGV